MLPSHGTVFFLFVHLLLLCQGDRPAGERLRGVVRRGTERCASPVGCGEKARGESIAESSRGRLWEEGVVPFVFEANLRDEVRASFSKAMAMWERETCIRFVPRTAEEDYVELGEGRACLSEAVGQSGGRQSVFLSLESNCASTGHALHELGHVLGFWHEHMRSDRDKFIKIQWHNILCWACKNFVIAAANSTLGVPYDLASIMHYKLGAYGALGLAIQVLPTTPRPALCTKIGQRNALSALDILKTNLLYNCTRELERPPKDDCQLQREANPPGFILKGDTVTFRGAEPLQRNMSLYCSATNCSLQPDTNNSRPTNCSLQPDTNNSRPTNCSLQPDTNNSRPTQLSVHTVYVTYRSRIHSGSLVVLGSNGSWLDCSGPTCALTDCPEQGERRIEGRFCVRHLLIIHFEDPEVGDGEHEGLQSGSEVSLTPAFKGTPWTCSNCPAKTDKRGLKSLIINKWDN